MVLMMIVKCVALDDAKKSGILLRIRPEQSRAVVRIFGRGRTISREILIVQE